MNQGAELIMMGCTVLLLTLPLGLVVGVAGRKNWIAFWIVALVLITITALLFSKPGHNSEDVLFVGSMATFGILVDGLLIRAGLRAALRRWQRSDRRPAPLS